MYYPAIATIEGGDEPLSHGAIWPMYKQHSSFSWVTLKSIEYKSNCLSGFYDIKIRDVNWTRKISFSAEDNTCSIKTNTAVYLHPLNVLPRQTFAFLPTGKPAETRNSLTVGKNANVVTVQRRLDKLFNLFENCLLSCIGMIQRSMRYIFVENEKRCNA
jgi:hypothetical protein